MSDTDRDHAAVPSDALLGAWEAKGWHRLGVQLQRPFQRDEGPAFACVDLVLSPAATSGGTLEVRCQGRLERGVTSEDPAEIDRVVGEYALSDDRVEVPPPDDESRRIDAARRRARPPRSVGGKDAP